jgi:hypothetical protein
MRVTNVTISYLREYQPEKFQKATPFIELSAVVDDGECYSGVARALLSEAVCLAYSALGGDVPAKIVDKLMLGKTVDRDLVRVAVDLADTVEVPAEMIETTAQPVEEDKPARRKRRTKVEMAADKAREEAEANSEIPGAEDTGRNISDNPEDRVNPEDNASEIPGSDPAPETAAPVETVVPEDVGKINVADIRSYVAKQLSDKKNSFDMEAYKKVLSENYDVIRTDDVPVDKLEELKELIDIAVAGI